MMGIKIALYFGKNESFNKSINKGAINEKIILNSYHSGKRSFCESITFFWQTTQAPSGPGGTFNLQNASGSASGRGPIPTALPVPEPAALGLILTGLFGLGVTRRKMAS